MTRLPIVRNETQGAGNGTSCLVCGAQIQQAATGRPARFCSSAHRIQHHRRRRREAEVTTTSDVPSSPTVTPVLTLQSAAALEDLADMLEQRSILPGAAALRHLAEEAIGLETLLETIEPAIAASPDHNVASTLQDLCEHRDQLSRMAPTLRATPCRYPDTQFHRLTELRRGTSDFMLRPANARSESSPEAP